MDLLDTVAVTAASGEVSVSANRYDTSNFLDICLWETGFSSAEDWDLLAKFAEAVIRMDRARRQPSD